ncbi:ABC transporter permease [Pseudorhodoferax sp. Leaf267]|uniref:ABC transporter permease n=1 Tax=Pseudorhodoferax sp. Leaf267 TaxID=1736316 RepID=UPI0006F6AADA|nr:FtsX-like permease family protein [Pseudorhodoferax sp. Leaf267]KQP23235.1 ABC transporter permease [Pseudorhodoferax sp. Leaf267]
MLIDLAWRDLRASGRPLWVFCACLALGVALVMASGGLYRQVAGALHEDARALFGGDLEVRHADPLPAPELDWIAARGEVSRLIELRSMLRSADGRTQLVTVQSADARYPLYGAVELAPPQPLADALAQQDGRWGIALDAVLAQRLNLTPGATVHLGDLALQVRATIARQPDRSLRADWNGAPVLLAEGALAATGLVQPLSRVHYHYRVRTPTPPAAWRDNFIAAFPQSNAEVRSFAQRSERVAQVLEQVGSALMLIGLSALFIGGLGVFNSVQAYLQGKLGLLATLRALGLRDARLAVLVLLQILMLALVASALGVAGGGALALGGVALAARSLPLAQQLGPQIATMAGPAALAMGFGVLTALAFALPPLGRALTVSPAALFRGLHAAPLRTPAWAWLASAGCGLALAALLVGTLPDPRLGWAFLAVVAALLAVLEGVQALLRTAARRLLASRWQPAFELRLALASLQRPGSALRPALLSLGTALTLLVACTLTVAALLRTIADTVPREAPGMVLHDVQTEQLPLLREALAGADRLQTAPLVLGRLAAVNGEPLRESSDTRRAREARNEHKLSTRAGNVDDVVVERGALWPADYQGPPLVAMEDREADQLDLQVGDRLRFDIQGQSVEAELAAIYGQRRLQARLWLEGIFSDGVLDPYITRHVGAAWLGPQQAIAAQDRLAAQAPNIVSVRTDALLSESRLLLGRASAALAVIAGICLLASLLVLTSVVAASRARQVYESSVLHVLGARLGSLQRALRWEYAVLAVVTSAFATLAGSALALALLQWRLELDASGLWWTGAVAALGVSAVSLALGAQWLLAQLRLSPASLLRGS